jgi:pSer/pThr/pTyr-binding forkhead associated (FHA) protein
MAFEQEPDLVRPRATLWTNHRLTVAVEGASHAFEKSFDQPFLRVGSHASADLALKEDGVAYRHLYIHATNEGVYCTDLSKRKSIGGRSRGWLTPDRVVKLGDVRLRAWTQPLIRFPLPQGDLQDRITGDTQVPALSIFNQGAFLSEAQIRRKLTLVGRAPPSVLRINSSLISRCHCAFYWDYDVLWVIDLLGSGGITYRGQRITATPLPLGDQVSLGEITLKFSRLELPASSITAAQKATDAATHAATVLSTMPSANHRPVEDFPHAFPYRPLSEEIESEYLRTIHPDAEIVEEEPSPDTTEELADQVVGYLVTEKRRQRRRRMFLVLLAILLPVSILLGLGYGAWRQDQTGEEGWPRQWAAWVQEWLQS